MRIRTKSALIILATTLCLIIIAQVLASAFINAQVTSTEGDEVNDAVDRLGNTIDDRIGELNTITTSCAYWDDSYYFMQYGNQSYVDGNFNTPAIVGLRVDFVLALNSSMGLVVGKAVDLENETDAPLENATLDAITSDPMIRETPTEEGAQRPVSGLIELPQGICMISSRAIYKSDLSGPSNGFIIIGRYLDNNEIAAISDLNNLPFSISAFDDPVSREFSTAKNRLENGTSYLASPINNTAIAGFGAWNDLSGTPTVIVRTELDRSAYQQGMRGLNMLLVLSIVAGAIVGTLSLLLQDRFIFSRMHRMGRDMRIIGEEADPSYRLFVKGNDEIRTFADDANGMLASLERAGTDLKESEEKFRNIFNNVGDSIFIHYPEGPYFAVNDAAVARFGYSREELLKMRPQDLDAPEQAATIPLHVEEIRRHGSAKFSTVHLTKGGVRTPSEIDARMITWAGRPAILVDIRDISDRIKAEENEVNIKRLEAVGQLAGSVAHDFNNLFTGVTGNLALARAKLAGNDQVIRYLDEIERATTRAASIAQGMLAFSSGGEPIRRPSDIGALIKGTIGQRTSRSSVIYDLDIPPDLWLVDVDPGQIGSTMESVIENACYSMPQGGRIEITFRNFIAAGGERLDLGAGRYVIVSIRDHGMGMPSEVVSRVFDPYFTTRPGALGLGLTMAFATAGRNGGTIGIESIVGEGTTLHIYLPASDHQGQIKERQPSVQKSGGHILLMDDEDYILDINKEILNGLGYSTEEVHDGQEALAAYIRAMNNGHRFDAVIMDLTIPEGMGGKEAIQKLLEIDPGARAIVSSGYSNDPVMAHYREHGFMGVVPKPYKIEELATCLANVLE
jgi:PAS domain S-box-containing protein